MRATCHDAPRAPSTVHPDPPRHLRTTRLGRPHCSPFALLRLLLLLLAAGIASCVHADESPGVTLPIDLLVHGQQAAADAGIHSLRLVIDHVELIACTPAVPGAVGSLDAGEGSSFRAGLPGAARSLGALFVSPAHAAHLPPAPHRLLLAEPVDLRELGDAPLRLGVLAPPAEAWCGARLGIVAALPETRAEALGVPVGESLRMRVGEPAREVVGSLGFDLEGVGSEWLPLETLRGGVRLVASVDLGALAARVRAGEAERPADVARAILEGGGLTVEAR